MEIYYDEDGKVITDPDLENGYVTDEKIEIGQHLEVMPGTNGLRRIVKDYGIKKVYHPNPVVEENTAPTLEERIAAIEETLDTLVMSEMDDSFLEGLDIPMDDTEDSTAEDLDPQ